MAKVEPFETCRQFLPSKLIHRADSNTRVTYLLLEFAGVHDGGLGRDRGFLVQHLLFKIRQSFQALDDLHRFLVRDFAKNDVLAIQPRGDDSGDEKLGAVAVR